MGTSAALAPIKSTQAPGCRLVVREQRGLSEILEFVTAGIEIGQQVVAMAGPSCLKDLALALGQSGLRPEGLIRSGRLIFLTAPDCLTLLKLPTDPLQRGSLRLNGSVLRWVSDWSWAYGNALEPSVMLQYQCRVHDFVRSVTPLSICTAHCDKSGRSSLLALVADHRRASRVAHHT